jgi:multidrug efflux pump subunit AcrA (membrane-fusion protein)
VVFPSINEGFSAPLTHVGDYIDPSNRTFMVTLRAPQGEKYMRPNLLGDLSIQDSHTDSAMVVPSAAVLDDVGGNSYLFVLGPAPQGANVGSNERVAQKIFVDRVSEYQGRMNVAAKTAGELKDGAMVVIDGAKNVSDGQTVRVDEN